ncbi:MAG: hypothetical protein GY754_00935 [bacterium]|nr:hypothetical protein [bacterium]
MSDILIQEAGEILEQSAAAVRKNKWARKLFSTGGLPPVEKTNTKFIKLITRES